MVNAARHEPEAVAALRAGRDDKVNRLLRLPLPEPYLPSRIEAFRDRKQARPQPDKAASKQGSKQASKHASKQGAKGPGGKAPRNPDPPLRPALPRTDDRPAHRSRHHGSGQRHAGQRPTRRSRALEGQHYG